MRNSFYIAPIAVVLSAITQMPVSAQVLDKDQFVDQIVGRELVSKKRGMKVKIKYHADGLVEIASPFFSVNGKWKFVDGKICADISSGPKKGNRCMVLNKIGPNQYQSSNGQTMTVSN